MKNVINIKIGLT